MRVPRPRRRPRTALLLVLLLLIPLGTLAAVTGSAAWNSRRVQQTAADVKRDATRLAALMAAQVAVLNEDVPATALAQGADFGLSPQQMQDISGVDYVSALRTARAVVDRNAVLAGTPELATDLAAVRRQRPGIDAGHAGPAAVIALFARFTADIDAIWARDFVHLRADVAASPVGSGQLSQRVEATADGFTVLTAAMRRAAETSNVVKGPGTAASAQSLIEANGSFVTAAAGFPSRLGPQAAAAWTRWQRDPAAISWEATIRQTVRFALAGKRSPLAANVIAFGAAFALEPAWLNDLTTVLGGAAADMRDLAHHEEAAAVASYQTGVAVFGFGVLLVFAAGLLLARAIVRPLGRLAAAARQVTGGDFSPAAVTMTGPREVADTIRAVDDMTAVLAAVEAFHVTLATNPTATTLDVALPGRTGRALQLTSDRLRESVLTAERRRQELSEVASHDGLTGLLNRSAAFEAIGRELARAARASENVTALFVDLDGLKAINDTYGHQAGDQAIRLTATALRSAARGSDVVSRLGGDEFLVVGTVHDTSGHLQGLADRLHLAVTGCTLEVDGHLIGLRCSVGGALSTPGDDVETLVHRADQALYKAKAQGGDQVCLAGSVGQPESPLPTAADTAAAAAEPAVSPAQHRAPRQSMRRST